MTDGPMTATEVQFRMDEARKRFPVPNFSSVIYALARKAKREALRSALQGSSEDRIAYCLNRVAVKLMSDLVCYGTVVYDPNKMSELAIRWLDRLERLAHRRTFV